MKGRSKIRKVVWIQASLLKNGLNKAIQPPGRRRQVTSRDSSWQLMVNTKSENDRRVAIILNTALSHFVKTIFFSQQGNVWQFITILSVLWGMGYYMSCLFNAFSIFPLGKRYHLHSLKWTEFEISSDYCPSFRLLAQLVEDIEAVNNLLGQPFWDVYGSKWTIL